MKGRKTLAKLQRRQKQHDLDKRKDAVHPSVKRPGSRNPRKG